LIVAVGSVRGPKVEAVRRALAALGAVHPPFAGAEVVGCDVSEVAPVMPVGLDALVDGAQARAGRALAQTSGAELGIGLEGGLDVRPTQGARRTFLVAWACVTDGRRHAHGCGGSLPLPDRLAADVLDRGLELSAAIDAFSGRHDVRSQEGAWGILTRGALDRSRTFEIALVNALAPFYNREHYA
jgi:inosine/xanthosine triphosphatase